MGTQGGRQPFGRIPREVRPRPGTFDTGSGLDVAQISCHARRVSDVVEAELAHQGAVLQQQGQGLPDAPRGPQHCHLGIVLGKKKQDNKHVVEL